MIEQYHDAEGRCFNGASKNSFYELLKLAEDKAGLSSLVYEECAAFSIAMVARSALGLSGADSKVHVYVDDSIFGLSILGAARHLVNSGGSVSVFIHKSSATTERHKRILEYSGVQFPTMDEFNTHLNSAHLSLVGMTEKPEKEILDYYSDTATPVHTTGMPICADPDTGTGAAVFSSSTISLGIPLLGLRNVTEHAGRLYICDLSIPGKVYEEANLNNVTSLFHSQPVVQIFPLSEEKLNPE